MRRLFQGIFSTSLFELFGLVTLLSFTRILQKKRQILLFIHSNSLEALTQNKFQILLLAVCHITDHTNVGLEKTL